MNKLKNLALGAVATAACMATSFATDSAPVDLSATGTTIAGYAATAAAAGLAVFAAIKGVRIILKAFNAMAK